MRGEANLDLIRSDGGALYLHFPVDELLCLVTVAERRVEVAFYVDAALVCVLRYRATGNEHGNAEKVVRRHRS